MPHECAARYFDVAGDFDITNLLGRSALLPAERESAIENKVRHAFRMLYSIGNRNGTALGNSKEREAFYARGIDNRLKVAQPRVK